MIDTIRELGKYVKGTHAERLVLLALCEAEVPVQISHVAERVGMSRGAMTSITDRLELQKLVRRVHGDDDRRIVRLEATPAGRKAVERASA
jgi:DNA-binding MarR family transcriptional regulator